MIAISGTTMKIPQFIVEPGIQLSSDIVVLPMSFRLSTPVEDTHDQSYDGLVSHDRIVNRIQFSMIEEITSCTLNFVLSLPIAQAVAAPAIIPNMIANTGPPPPMLTW